MNPIHKARWMITTLTAIALTASVARAQQHETHQPKQPAEHAAPATTDQRIGGPYALDTCPISGKKLGAMGDPVVKTYDGREVRFCCSNCPATFEKDLAASWAKLDEKIVKDQLPLYPLKTSIVTGKDLPEKPYNFVYGNRLILLGAESEKAAFVSHAAKLMDDLDKAVITAQGKSYALKNCPVSKEDLGDMGEAKNVVIAGRLIKLCCNDCKKDLEENPAKFVAMIDAARTGTGTDPKPDHKDHDKPDSGK